MAAVVLTLLPMKAGLANMLMKGLVAMFGLAYMLCMWFASY